jgi:hypothetical protein
MMNKKHKSGKNGEFKCTTSGGVQRCTWVEADAHWLGERDLSWTPPIDKPEQPRIIIDPDHEAGESDPGESPIMGAGQKFAQLRIEDFSPKMKAPRSKSKMGVRRGGGSASVSGGGGKG